MKDFIRDSTLKQRLFVAALVLGAFALIAGDPYHGRIATIDAKELGLMVGNKVDHVMPADLADWIIAGKVDYRLVDIRTPEEFAMYAIPGAENVPLSDLTDGRFLRNEKLVLYSEGGIHSAQAWFLLKSQGYKAVYMLFGGLDGWKDDVLFPRLPDNASATETVEFGKKREVSKFFGGSPRSGGEAGTQEELITPKLEMPAPIAVPSGGAKKKRKEGC